MKRIVNLLLVLALIATAGCQRKELLDPHDHNNLIIKAHFDSLGRAQLLSNKSDYALPGTPATTSYIFYEKNTQNVAYKGSFKGLEGGMYVQEGMYDLLIYTTDFNELDANFYRGMDKKETAETHTRQRVTDQSARSDVKEMHIVEPDPTFSALYEDVVVFRGDEDKVLDIEFVQKSFKYYLTIKCTGLHNIHSATMNISGMYTSAFLIHDAHRMDEAGTQSLDMKIILTKPTNADEIGKGELYGEFWSFGPNQREDISNTITLYFHNGYVYELQLNDLTGQIKTLTKGGEIIVEQVLEIKGPPGGFQPGVGDWNQTDVDIIL